MKTKNLYLLSCLLFVLSGCCYYTHPPQTNTIGIHHGRSYVNHFEKISQSKNWGAFFTRDTLDKVLKYNSDNGVNIFIGCENTFHPLIMELANGEKNKFKIKSSKKCYLSSEYVTHACFDINKDGNCMSVNNYSNTGKCEVTGAYFPRNVIEKILENKKFTGIVVYIGLDASGKYPLIMQGTKKIPDPKDINLSSTYSVVSRTYCPRVCGTLKDQ